MCCIYLHITYKYPKSPTTHNTHHHLLKHTLHNTTYCMHRLQMMGMTLYMEEYYKCNEIFTETQQEFILCFENVIDFWYDLKAKLMCNKF